MHARVARAAFPAIVVILGAACGTSPQISSPPAPGALAPGGGTVAGSGGTVGPVADGGGGAGEDAGSAQPAPPPAAPGDASILVDGAGTPPPADCVGTPEWAPGDAKTISIALGDAAARSYDVYVGTGVKAGTPVPLLVNMHGITNSPAIQAQFSQMNPVADTNGFVVVYPAGLTASFNAGSCCGQSSASDVDDVGFVRAVVADAESKICVNKKRVYETGFSNGGMMAYQLACNAADLFAAVAPTEGENVTNTPCNPSRPVPLAAFESLGDPVVLPVNAQQSAQAWAKQASCTDAAPAQAMEAAFSCQEWSQCGGGSLVWYCTLPFGTHLPPAGSAPVIWSFLSRFSLP